MGAALDATMPAAALRLVTKFGIAATVELASGLSVDAESGSVSGSPAQHPVTVTPPQPAKAFAIDGVQVLRGDCFVYAAGSGLPFAASALKDAWLVLGSERWSVVGWVELKSGELLAALKIQVRR